MQVFQHIMWGRSRSWSRSRRAKYDQYSHRIKIFPILQIQFNLVLIETPMAGKSASLTFRLGFARLSRSQCQKCSQQLLRPPPHHPPFFEESVPAENMITVRTKSRTYPFAKSGKTSHRTRIKSPSDVDTIFTFSDRQSTPQEATRTNFSLQDFPLDISLIL